MAFDFGLVVYLALWYLGNYYYNIQNKNASNASGGSTYAMTCATLQLFVGVVYALFLWLAPGARKPPSITFNDFLKMIPVGICSAGAHAASVFSLAAGGVAFGQIVKAAEPAFAAVIGTFIYKKEISAAKWMCLIPIIGGVCLAALKQNKDGSVEMDFTIGGLVGALIANVFASFKGQENHRMLNDASIKQRIGGDYERAGNQFAIMTIISFLVSIPLVFIREGPILPGFFELVSKNGYWNDLTINILLSGVTFYMYNEVATMTLTKISPVQNSVANTAKRVVVIVGSAIVFKEEISGLKGLGCAICIAGVFLDSIINNLVYKADHPKWGSNKPKAH